MTRQSPARAPDHSDDLTRRAFAEALGTALLVLAVVGSGIAASQLSAGDTGLALLENAVATAGALVALIYTLGPVSGAHMNPVVTIADRALGGISMRAACGYVAAQFVGGSVGAVVANVIFSRPAVTLSTTVRTGGALWTSEVVATFGLLLVIFGLVRSRRKAAVPLSVAAYIGGAYFFTSSTSFANPAVTIARTLSDTFSGISPGSAPSFLAAQLLGAALAVVTVRYLYPTDRGAREPESDFSATQSSPEPAMA